MILSKYILTVAVILTSSDSSEGPPGKVRSPKGKLIRSMLPFTYLVCMYTYVIHIRITYRRCIAGVLFIGKKMGYVLFRSLRLFVICLLIIDQIDGVVASYAWYGVVKSL